MAAIPCAAPSAIGSPSRLGAAGWSDPLLPPETARSGGGNAGHRAETGVGSSDVALAPPGGCSSEPAGLEHLERRLHRCEALPAEQRCPEATAFLQAVQLLQQIPSLLPLDPRGQPAQAPPLHQQALAFALAAAADSIAPQAPPLASRARCHLRAFMAPLAAMATQEAEVAAAAAPDAEHVPPSATAGTQGRASVGRCGSAAGSPPAGPASLPPLAILLVQYAAAVEQAEAASLACDAVRALQAYAQLAGLARCLAHPTWQAAVDAQLAELAAAAAAQQAAMQHAGQLTEGAAATWQPASSALQAGQARRQGAQPNATDTAPLLTAARLRFAASCTLAGLVSSLLNGDRQASFLSSLPAFQEAQLRAVAASAGAVLLEQAPGSPRACLLAAYCGLAADGSFSGGAAARRQALQLYQRAHVLACEQSSDHFQVRAACGWLMLAATATNVGSAVQAAHLQASLAAHRRASSALRRCCRLLPLVWVSTLKGSLAIAAQLLPSAEAQLEQLAGAAHDAAAAGVPVGKRPLTGAHRRALRSSLATAAGATMKAAASSGAAVEASTQCCACRRSAIGLRLCAGCGTARYCSRDCQVAAWPAHKLECRPAGSSEESK